MKNEKGKSTLTIKKSSFRRYQLPHAFSMRAPFLKACAAQLHGHGHESCRNLYLAIVNRGTGYETLELSKARTMLLQSMLNWPWPGNIFSFCFARVRKLVVHNLIEGFDWLSSRKKVCFVQGQGQKYGQKHETKELVHFHNHFHGLTMIWLFISLTHDSHRAGRIFYRLKIRALGVPFTRNHAKHTEI